MNSWPARACLLLFAVATSFGAAAEEAARPPSSPTLRDTVIQAGSGNAPVFTATLEQLQLERARERSAYELLRDANLRAQIESRMAEPGIRDEILGNDAVASLIDIAQVLITNDGSALNQKGKAKVRLMMAKGTYVDLLLDPALTLAVVQLGSARTAGGQLIPRTLDEVSGYWAALPGDDLQALAEHVRLLGGTVVAAQADVAGIQCRQGQCELTLP